MVEGAAVVVEAAVVVAVVVVVLEVVVVVVVVVFMVELIAGAVQIPYVESQTKPSSHPPGRQSKTPRV